MNKAEIINNIKQYFSVKENAVEYVLPINWTVGDEYAVFRGITLEEADDLSLIFKGITFEAADRKLMDSLFFAQN